jgi:hypothetical protein
MKNWINKHYKSLIIGAFLIPIITVAIVSISHVTKWYGISNPLSWSVYLSIGIEIAALSALAAISADMGKKVYFPFAIVTIIQFIGNIFFAYSYIDINSQGFKDWVDLVSPLVSFMGVEPTDFIGHKRFLAFFAGGMLPIISLSFLHMLVKFTEEDRIKEQENLNKVPVEDKINASDLISEVSRIRLSEDDLKKLEETLLNPPKPNENLKSAAFYYKSKVEESEKLKAEENKNSKVNNKPISREETELVFKSRVDFLSEIMQKDEELGLYNETFDKPLVKEPIVSDDFTIGPDGAFEMTEEILQELNQQQITPALSDEEVREMFMDEWERKFDLVEEKEFSTIEPTEEEESRNFSTITTNTENIFQDNTEDYEGQFQDWGIETVPEPFTTIEEIQNPITNSVEPTEVEVPSSDEGEKKN